MKITIIGNGTQSKRIQKILNILKIKFNLYIGKKPDYYNKSEINAANKSKIIFITTPNNSHLKYIKTFKKKYIFCEKPPVTNNKDLLFLRKIKSKKIYFNYNFRFSKFADVYIKFKKKLGDLQYANITISHGLALTKKYSKNWRSNKIKSPTGVLETLSIHYIDLINYLLDIKKIEKPILLKKSNKGNSFDTSYVKIITKDNAIISIFSTYRSCYAKKILFLFSNGIIEQNEDSIEVRGPAFNFDKNGLFKKPKLIRKYYINSKKDYIESTKKSILFFLKSAKKNKTFNEKDFNTSIETNKLTIK
jgi:predicted dehydrogenase